MVLLKYLDVEIDKAKKAIDILTEKLINGSADSEAIERRLIILSERYQVFLEVRNKCRTCEMLDMESITVRYDSGNLVYSHSSSKSLNDIEK